MNILFNVHKRKKYRELRITRMYVEKGKQIAYLLTNQLPTNIRCVSVSIPLAIRRGIGVRVIISCHSYHL